MHEMGIAASLLDAIRAELARYPGARATRAGLRLGEYSGVDRESLSFCYGVLVEDSGLAPLALDIEFEPRGRDLDLIYLELDDE
ncbi:MAG: hydrogenase maturation nickel metallochaperone HypA [Bryobacterales bacterium]|nr:hydrogenase maturation nickel metallochaperone HypA [Bryobacterales bacterium]